MFQADERKRISYFIPTTCLNVSVKLSEYSRIVPVMLFYLLNGIIIKAFEILYISMSMIRLGIKCIKMQKFKTLKIQIRLNSFSSKIELKSNFFNNDSSIKWTVVYSYSCKTNVRNIQ